MSNLNRSAITCSQQVKLFNECFVDIDQQALCLYGYQQQYQQLGSGKYNGQYISLIVNDYFGVHVEKTNKKIEQQGCVPKQSFAFNFFMSEAEHCIINGQQVNTNHAFILPPQHQFIFLTSSNMVMCSINLNIKLLELLPVTCYLAQGVRLLSFSPSLLQSLRLYIQSTIKQFIQSPSLLLNDIMMQHFQARVTSMVTCLLSGYQHSETSPKTLAPQQSLMLFNRSRNLIHSDTKYHSLNALSLALKASRRSIEYAFSKTCGISPARYIKRLQMNEIKRLLQQSQNAEKSIGDIVANWEIWNLGRFSGEYQQFFGELPSVTKAGQSALPSYQKNPYMAEKFFEGS